MFMGEDSTFFFISGGIVDVADNSISYNGLLFDEMLTNSVSSFNRRYKNSNFPWDNYDF